MRHMAQLRAMFGCSIAKVVRKIQIMEWPRLRQSLHYSTHYSIQSVYFGHNSVKTWQLLLPFSTSSILASSYSTVDILNVLQRYLYFPVQPPNTIILIVGYWFGIFYKRSKKRMKVTFSKIRTLMLLYNSLQVSTQKMFKKKFYNHFCSRNRFLTFMFEKVLLFES